MFQQPGFFIWFIVYDVVCIVLAL